MTTLSTDWKLLNDKTVSYGPWSGKFKLYAKIVSTDIANNRTKVAYDWDFETTAGYSAMSYDAQDYVTAAGWNSAEYRTYSGSGNLRHGEEWITHNADGTKSSSCSGRTRMGGIGVDTGWVSADFDLPRIPRASSPTLSPNPQTWSNTTSNTLTVTTNRKASSFTHSVRCDVWSYKVTNTGVGTSTTFAIPYSTLGSMPDDQLEFTGSVYTQTYSGSTKIGSEVKSQWKIQVDTNLEHPNIGTVALSEGNSRVAAIVNTPNTFVQGISTLVMSVPITVSGSYTQLAKATVSNGSDNQTYTLSGTSGTVSYSSENIRTTWLTITAYDKRGTTAVSKPSWTLLPYAPLTATAAVGRTSSTGSVAVGQVSGVAYGGEYGQSTNSLTISYRYKEHDASSWTDGAETFTQSISSGSQTYTRAITFSEEFDYQKQYDIQFTVSDLFSTATYTAQLMQGLPILSWDETEVDVFGDLHIHNRDNPYIYQDVMAGFDAVLAHGGQKNLCPQIVKTTTAVQGVTWTPSDDGTVKSTGTSTGPAQVYEESKAHLPVGKYKFSGCPSGGSTSTYFFRVLIYNSSGTLVDYATDKGEGNEFEITDDSYYIRPFLSVNQGATAPSGTWKPMIWDANLASTTYEPYYVHGIKIISPASFTMTINNNSEQYIDIGQYCPTGYEIVCATLGLSNQYWTHMITNINSNYKQAAIRNQSGAARSIVVQLRIVIAKV